MNVKSNIILIGMPATGKSTYGRQLAKELGMDFVDTDDLIEKRAGLSCSELMKQQGNDGFARIEREVIQRLDYQNTVIATGGSVIYFPELAERKSTAMFVHLRAKRRTLERRFDCMIERAIVFDEGMTFRDLYEQRMPLYEAMADIEFSTDEMHGSEQQLAQQLVDRVVQWQQQQAVHQQFMSHALSLAEKAQQAGEVPVGAVLVLDGKIIGEGWNQMIGTSDPTAHAEIQAIRAAASQLSNYRLNGTTLYVTLEPCAMCAGALVHARVQTVVFAARDPRTGAAGSVFSILNNPVLNHRCEVIAGVLQAESEQMLKTFFQSRRN